MNDGSQMASINGQFIFRISPFLKSGISLKSPLFNFGKLSSSVRDVDNPQQVLLKDKKVKKDRLLIK